MILVYLSLTGNVKRFVESTNMDSVEINYSNPFIEVDSDYLIVCPTYDDDITDLFSDFIDHKNNLEKLNGFIGSGNLNFDQSFCFNAKDLSKKYNKPLIFTFEFSGTEKDLEEFIEEVHKVGITRTTKEI